MNAYDAAENDGRADRLHFELSTLFESHNRAGAGTELPATFLKVTADKR